MRIVDQNFNPLDSYDESKGRVYTCELIREDAEPLSDTKPCWLPEDREEAIMFIAYSDEDIAQRQEYDEQQANINSIPDIQDALVEVADIAANNEVSMSDVQDALIELADIISSITEDNND